MESVKGQAPNVEPNELRKFKIFVEDMHPKAADAPVASSGSGPQIQNVYDPAEQRKKRDR